MVMVYGTAYILMIINIYNFPVLIRQDKDGDGSIDVFYKSYYSGELKIKEETDSDGDSIIDRITFYEYDASNYITQQSYDNDADGTIDNIHGFSYNSNGKRTSYVVDYGADGYFERVTEYFYNSDGLMIKEELDSDANGSPKLYN